MDNIYKFIVENISSGQINKHTAIDLIKQLKDEEKKTDKPIAIIGMAAKLPMANNIYEFWNNIHNGINSITHFPKSRAKDIDDYLYYTNFPKEDIKYNFNAYMDEIDKFDYKFFKLSPKEASLMDPHQRLFLEVAWEAIEDAGYGGSKLSGTNTGVYLGLAPNLRDLYSRIIYEVNAEELALSLVGNLTAVTSSRLSYILNLKGPSMIIDTSCSSSLVSINCACQSIRNNYCDMAIAGGIKINTVPIDVNYLKIGIESSDGYTRAFDNSSDGSGIGEGVGVIVLKPLENAIRDRDNIYAIIRGSSVNQDGASAGITAPNPAAQSEVIVDAWKSAGISPETIGYIETHGTGTSLGDPIEIKGLINAFKQHTNKKQFCAISSVKTNIGHLSESAGVISLIKAVLALKNKEIPPSLYFMRPNKSIDFANSPVYINTMPRKWELTDMPRRCGISGFGISGTNCHIVLEESGSIPQENTNDRVDDLKVLTITAKSKDILYNFVQKYKYFLDNDIQNCIDDICYTANTGRGHYNYRLAIIIKNKEELKDKISYLLETDFDEVNNPDIFYGKHKITSKGKNKKEDITESEKIKISQQAEKIIQDFKKSKLQNNDMLNEICSLYISGAEINWEGFYDELNVKKISVPTYPFERSRCWLNVPKVSREFVNNKENVYFTTVWKQQYINNNIISKTTDTVLIFKTIMEKDIDISAKFKADGIDVIEVIIGKSYNKINDNSYVISGTQKDYIDLILDVKNKNISTVLHMMSISEDDDIESIYELENDQLKGVMSMFYFTKALIMHGNIDKASIIIISNYVNSISGNEKRLYPSNAALIGLGKVIGQEYPNISCRAIDIDDNVTEDELYCEINLNVKEYFCSYRDKVRYVEEFTEVNIENIEDRQIKLKENGVYVITGGTGGIGLEIALKLASECKIKLALLNRSAMPQRSEWDLILENKKDKKLINKIEKIKQIEKLGSEIILFSTDISKIDEVMTVFDELRKSYGCINGIIHSAGIAGAGFIVRKDEQHFKSVLQPKIQGTWILDNVTKDDKLDFLVLFSSGSSFIGEAGQGDYVAANSYLDSYTAYRNKKGKKTLTINWVSWKEVGMSVEYGINFDGIFKAIPTETAVNSFWEALNKNLSRVLIGSINYKDEFMSILLAIPYKISEHLLNKINVMPMLDQNKPGQKVITNDGHEMAVINDDGKVIFLPYNGKNASEKIKSSVNVKLKGKDNGLYSEVEKKVANIFSQILGFEEISINDSFFELGGDSVLLTQMHRIIDKEFPGQILVADLFSYSSVYELSRFIISKEVTEENLEEIDRKDKSTSEKDDIAIIGMSVMFPGAENLDEYWKNILEGNDELRKFPNERGAELDKYLKFIKKFDDVSHYLDGAYLEKINEFDYKFFNISPKEASLMDPSQRYFMQTVWNVIEDAGYSGDKLIGSNTGIYVGFAANSSYQRMVYDVDSSSMSLSTIGNIAAIMPSRLSYMLNLKGPTMVVDTACSASLVSVHLACQAINNNDCEMAIASGLKLHFLPIDSDFMKIGIESTDGKTRTFDNNADGTGIGEGIAAVFLKPLKNAVKDGDSIYAVIKGSAINQDGKSIGLTAPNSKSQADVIIKAWNDANVNPETISYIEAHGTGTKLGDPIEIDGIQRAFSKYTNKKQFCAVSAVKPNIGHLHECAGIASLIKAILALKYGIIPPSINFDEPNNSIDFTNSPIYVNTRVRNWEKGEFNNVRRCGVSAFGLSGTNCHIILEEAPVINYKEEFTGLKVFTLSARSEYSLKNLILEYVKKSKHMLNFSLENICYSASVCKNHYEYRIAILAENTKDLFDKITYICDKDIFEIRKDWFLYGKYKIISNKKEVKEPGDISISEKNILETESEELINNFILSDKTDKKCLIEICKLYCKGSKVDWEKIYDINLIHKINLPLYPFEPYKCWLDIPEVYSNDISPNEISFENEIFFSIKWKYEEINENEIEKMTSKGVCLLFTDEKGIGKDISSKLKQEGNEVIEVTYNSDSIYERLDDNHYNISGCFHDYDKIIEDMKDKNLVQIYHLQTIISREDINDINELKQSLNRGTYSLFYLIKSIINHNIRKELQLILVSENSYEVIDGEKNIKPENTSFIGMGKVISQEYPNINCIGIDIDSMISGEDILRESRIQKKEYLAAYRNGKRYVELFTDINLEEEKDNDIEIKQDGVYVITGGVGGIGLEMANYLSFRNNVKLALISRTPMPERRSWNEILEEKLDINLCEKISKIIEMENRGSNVQCYSADVTDMSQMNQIMEQLRDKYGKINGIIHSAGVAGAGYIVRKEEDSFTNVLKSKIYGTWILDRVTKDDNLDFFVLFSSGVTISGEAGQSDYVAANSYLDSYSAFRNNKGKRTLTINWVQWKEAGMSVFYGINIDGVYKAIPTKQGVEAFGRVLNKNIKRVIIGEINYDRKYLSIFLSIPYRLSPKISKRVQLMADLYNADVNTQEQEQVITNNGFEMAIIDDKGKAIYLPRGKKRIDLSEEHFNQIKLTGKKEYSEVEHKLAKIFNEILGFKEINIYDTFFELGGDSIMLMRLQRLIDKEFPNKVNIVDLFSYSSISMLAEHIINQDEAQQDTKKIIEKSDKKFNDDDIAIIGLSAMMPHAQDIEEYWMNIINGIDSINEFPEQRKKDIYDYLSNSNVNMNDNIDFFKGAYLEKIDEFDNKFFKLTPKEASLMDPCQRLFLQNVWQTIEDAGYGGRKLSGSKTGVYIGFAASSDYQRMIFDNEPESLPISVSGNRSAILPTRISYILNLKGPTMVIDTACSSSIVSIHLACQAIKNGDCKMAIAGAVRINLLPINDKYFKIGIESSDDRTRTFDYDADGAGIGEGIASVLLKPLKEAQKDKDNIYAVIKATAINQDGSSMGLTAPNPDAQCEVIMQSWEKAGVSPETISYIEAHGTATKLGDPIEIDALNKAFSRFTDKKQFCAVSAVKSNIGHLNECAGMAGLIKAVMALKHRTIPPTLHFKRPNDTIYFNESPVYINTISRKWEKGDLPRRCGVSSFGISGTNSHLILEEAPTFYEKVEEKFNHNVKIFTLSAKTKTSLSGIIKKYNQFLLHAYDEDLDSICYTANTGREHFEHRVAVLVKDINDLKEKLNYLNTFGLKPNINSEIFYCEHKVVSVKKQLKDLYQITEAEKNKLSKDCNEKVEQFRVNKYHDIEIAKEICNLYALGADVNWDKLYTGQIVAKTSLPTYVFDSSRLWIDVVRKDTLEDTIQNNWFYYNMKWRADR